MRDGVAFVINPASGRGRGLRLWAELEPRARAYGLFEAALTERPRHGEEQARRFAQEGWPRIIAVGGDGTLNEVLNGVFGSESAIGCIPVGTGNDWRRTVGIPLDPTEALRVAFEGKVAFSDVGEAVGHGYFLNVMGAGFDAEVARRIADAKGALARLGPTARYLAAVLGTFRGYRPGRMTLRLDGREVRSERTLLAAVGIARYYGSGMRICPHAEIDDGLFDVVWGSDIRFRELPGLMRRIFQGRHLEHRKVATQRAVEIELASAERVPFHLDGDVRGLLPVCVRLHPSAARVIVP